MGPEVVVLVLLPIGFIAALWIAAKSGAVAPLEPVAPPEKPEVVYAFGDRVLLDAARRHGLRHELDAASGRVEGMTVTLRAVPHAAVEVERLKFAGEAVFPNELDLDLEVRPRDPAVDDPGPMKISEEVDSSFCVDALHEDQARTLLDSELGAALLDAYRSQWSPSLDDKALRIQVPGAQSEALLAEAFAWLLDTGRLVVRARRALPRSELEQAVQEVFRIVAEKNGGRVDVEHNELLIETDFGALRGSLERAGGREFRTVLLVDLEHAPAGGLHLGLESTRSALARWRQPDVLLGDDEFDATFVVKADDEDSARAVLDAPARAALLALAKRVDQFELEPERLFVATEQPIKDAAVLGSVLDAALNGLGTICPKVKRSPYR